MNEFVSSPTEVVKVGEPLPNSDEINKALEKSELYKRGFKEGYKQAIIDGKTNFSRPKGTWVLNCKRYYCSECGEDAIDLESEPDVFASNYCLTNYCPNCGAEMKRDKNKNTFSPWLKERLKDPEFRKVWEKTFGEGIQKDGEEHEV